MAQNGPLNADLKPRRRRARGTTSSGRYEDARGATAVGRHNLSRNGTAPVRAIAVLRRVASMSVSGTKDAAPVGFANDPGETAMRVLRILLTSSLVAFSLLTTPVSATSYSTDQSDLWYIPAESGWGIQLVQRGNLIFFTMFVYDPAGKPIWYVGTISPTGAPFTWSGDMYVTNGPWLGAQPYNPALFGGRIVGTLTWTGTSVTTGTLSYSVDGVSVTKNVVRQTLVNDDFNGNYDGGLHEVFGNCANPGNNGAFATAGLVDVHQAGTAITINTYPIVGAGCTYSGTLSQYGQMGDITGTYACTNGLFGTFHAFELQVNISGFTGRFTDNATALQCSGSGWFGGLRNTLSF